MTMYELWKVESPGANPARLEDDGGPVLFLRPIDADTYSRQAPDFLDVRFEIVSVRVGFAWAIEGSLTGALRAP